MVSPLTIGLVYDRFGDRPTPPGAPPDWDAEYEPEATIAALEAAFQALGCATVRLGTAERFLTLAPTLQAGRLHLDVVLSIAEGYGSRNREAHAAVLCELLGLPHLGSDALTLSLSLDKAWTKDLAAAMGVATPAWTLLRPDALPDAATLPPFPVFVKPRYEGTAKGIAPTSRCNDLVALRYEAARQHALYQQDLLVEAFVPGQEFTVAIVGNDPPEALPVLQRATEATTGIGLHALERFEEASQPFTYVLDGMLTPDLEARLHAAALRVYDKLEIKDFARFDFRVDAEGTLWFLEVNTLPTFAPDGTFAIIAELSGRSYAAFLSDVFARALDRLGVTR